MKNLILLSFLCLMFIVTGCEVIGDIFSAGFYAGLIVVVLVVAIIIWIISRVGRRG